MESTDEKILALLARDGRMSYTDVGKATGLSTSAAQQRVRRLEQRGVITGYRAVVDPASVGRMLTAFIAVRTVNPAEEDTIPVRVRDLPEVTSCYSVAGRYGHLLHVAVRSPQDLERLLGEIRSQANVSTETTLVLSVPFEDRPVV